jgi:FkbM family methyltransferase
LFENSAIGKKNGSQLFYSISESNAKGIRHSEILNGNGLDQLGSFDKMTILKHANMIPHFESFIKEIYVPTMTIEDLLKKYGVTNVNLLQIDTEGYDYEILNQEPFASVKPKILIFEHQHITRLQYKTLINKFRKFGYQFFVSGWDTICFLR